jgi:hypothetical protein
MSNIEDSNDVISITEKVNTLWKTYNNLINTNPTGTAFSETLPFQNFVIDSEIFNQNIPVDLLITQDISLDIFNNENILQVTININTSDISYLTIESLDSIFDANSNIQPGFKCNFSALGYPYLEYYYKKECYPTISNGGTSKQQIYTWFIPEPSNGDISFPTTKNLLKNTIPNKFDPYNNTYQYRLYQKTSNGTFNRKEFASYPDFAYLDNKSGFLYFYGGQRNGNNITLNYFRAQSLNDSTKSPPYLSYIKYIGNIGLNNVLFVGNTRVDGSLTLLNDLSFNEISNNDYNVLNTKQIKQYLENLNISGGSNNGLTLNEILNSNNDASFSNLDVSGFLNLNNQEVATKNYIDNSFTELLLFNDLSYNFNILDSQVQTICGSNFALKINEISNNVLILDSHVISISGRIENIKNIVNNLDVSYVTDSAFELSFNDLSNIYTTNVLFDDLSSNFTILENSFNTLDLSNSLKKIDNSLVNIQNNIDIINNSTSNISNKYIFNNDIELLNKNSIVNIVNSNGNKYVFNDSNSYDTNKKYGLNNGNYELSNIPIEHPIALLNNDVSNLITYQVVDDSPIVIKVSGGNFNSPFYNFTDNNDNTIDINNFKFMRNRSYQFNANGISSSHPFKIFVNNNFTNVISGFNDNISFTINGDHSLVDGTFYYICNLHSSMKNNLSFLNNSINGINYDFYYGDVSINVTEDFGNISVYCFYHGYMGGENLLVYLSNYYTTNNSDLQDLSSLFFNTITPNKNNSNILVTINTSLYCSYALEERISIELWRDLSMLTQTNNLGSVIATGGLTIPFNLTYLDENINNAQKKYYLKYKLENNNSQQYMGLINLETSQNNGFSNFLLREI